jgi:hypothetical protein
MNCRHCGFALALPLVDLGSAPPSNAYLTAQTLKAPEKWFPLRVLVCERCWLAQTEDFAQAHELFDADYAYFSGFSSSWLAHCERYVAVMAERFGLDAAMSWRLPPTTATCCSMSKSAISPAREWNPPPAPPPPPAPRASRWCRTFSACAWPGNWPFKANRLI